MPSKRLSPTSRTLVTLFESGSLGSQTDRDLLECFQSNSGPLGQEAFRILVERHGPMVLGLCRSVVRDLHEAEDAFQATFLVLVRKAASIERRDTLGPWLHGVAAKVARRARHRLNDRRQREVPVAPEIPGHDRPIGEDRQSEHLVHEEIARLPDSFRKPLVLCCLQGLSYDLAAQQLGVNHSTLRGRLERARKQLQSRLQRRGISVHSGAPLIASLATSSLPPLPSPLIESTVQLSLRWSRLTGLLGGGTVVPQSIATLAQGVVQSMLVQTVRVSAAALLALGAIGTVVVAQQGKDRVTEGVSLAETVRDGQGGVNVRRENEKILNVPSGVVVSYIDYEEKEAIVTIDKSMDARPQMKLSVFDAHSDPTPNEKPKGQIELTSIGEKNSHARILRTVNPTDPIRVGDIVRSPFWSPNRPTNFALVGKMDIDRDGKDDRETLKRMIQEFGGAIAYDLPPEDVSKESGKLNPNVAWYVTDNRLPLDPAAPAVPGAEAKLAERVSEVIKEARLKGIRPMPIEKLLGYLGQDANARPSVEKPAAAASFAAGSKQSANDQTVEKNARINKKLEMKTDPDFPKVGSLEVLLKTIKKITTDDSYSGIPIYVDPMGISEAKTSIETEIKALPGDQPIRDVLEHALRPLGLMFEVRDGLLMISSRTIVLEHRVEEIDRKLDRVVEMLSRLQQKN